MTVSRLHQLFQPKKTEHFFEITKKIKFEISGLVYDVCQLTPDRLAVLTCQPNNSNNSFIEIFDINTKKSITGKISIPESASSIHRLPNGKILCDCYFHHFIFDPETSRSSPHIRVTGHFVGILNQNEFVIGGPSGVSIINLDETIPLIKTELPWYDSGYDYQIWPDETIVVNNSALQIYRRNEGKFSVIDEIDLGFYHESIRVRENLIVKHFRSDSKKDLETPLLKVWAQEKGKWKPVPGLEYTPECCVDWHMHLRAIPDSKMFMLVGNEKITFFDSRTLKHFHVETDFGDTEQYAGDYDDDESDEENSEDPDYYHSSITVLDDRQIALGYDGAVILLTVQPIGMQLFQNFLMGTHKKVGKDSAICKFTESEIFEPRLLSLIFSFVEATAKEFKTEHSSLSIQESMKEDEKLKIDDQKSIEAAWAKSLLSRPGTSKDSKADMENDEEKSRPYKKRRI